MNSKFWKILLIFQAIVRLGGPLYQSIVDKIKSSEFNDEYLVHFREDLEAIRKELRDKIKVSTVSTEKYVQENIEKISSDFADMCDETKEIKKTIKTVSTRCSCHGMLKFKFLYYEFEQSSFLSQSTLLQNK